MAAAGESERRFEDCLTADLGGTTFWEGRETGAGFPGSDTQLPIAHSTRGCPSNVCPDLEEPDQRRQSATAQFVYVHVIACMEPRRIPRGRNLIHAKAQL